MQYSPKLKGAMAEIKAILQKHDIAAAVVLHTPGFSEFLLKIDPSYSVAKIDGDRVRFKANLQNDFNGDKEKFNYNVTGTANMLELLAETMGQNSLALFNVADVVNKATGAEHDKGNFSSDVTQNN